MAFFFGFPFKNAVKNEFMVDRPHCVHKPKSEKHRAYGNSLQTGRIWKRRLCIFTWTETILKTMTSR